ncbi:hypothetical protein QE152_g30385 [Popillia japonica]|uniref:Uncharacterized protein n=1 Tax=Popillia japonica TaxID=7064 RepID=A0AAW1JEG5_POPJA
MNIGDTKRSPFSNQTHISGYQKIQIHEPVRTEINGSGPWYITGSRSWLRLAIQKDEEQSDIASSDTLESDEQRRLVIQRTGQQRF